MAKISAFADEIGPDFAEQMRVCRDNDVRYIDLRGAWDANVMKLDERQLTEIGKQLGDNGISVAAIGSPIGKIRIDEDWDAHLDDFKRAVNLAERFDAPFVRIFSFYPPEGQSIADHRDEVLRRLTQFRDLVVGRPVQLVLENEHGIYCDVPERCADVMEALYSDQVAMAFDPANFIVSDVASVFEQCWKPLKRYVTFMHIKDWKQGHSPAVPCGEGDGCLPEILADLAGDGYDGFLTLEPHLSQGGQFGGHTGPELFKRAADALRDCCNKAGLSVE